MSRCMAVIEISKPGNPEGLKPAIRQVPKPGEDEVLIKTAAIGINRPDILQRKGFYPPPEGASDLPGLEVSGTIEAIGERVTKWQIGDQVCALLPGGGYSEYAIAHNNHCLPIPRNVSIIDAAGLPETIFTVWANVFDTGRLKPGETLLVHGGTSGIGVTAIKMALAHGAKIITTAGTPEKCKKLRAFGLQHVFQYNDDDWRKHINAAPINGVDIVLDMAGGDFLEKNITCLKPGGRHISIAFLRGIHGKINIMDVMRKRLTITGSTLRSRSVDEKSRLAKDIENTVWPWFAEHKMTATHDQTFSLLNAAKAHQYMEEGNHFGKILLLTEYGHSINGKE